MDKDKIPLFWYKPTNYKNFGDDLGPYIIAKLSGRKIKYVPLAGRKTSVIRFFVTSFYLFLRGKISFGDTLASFRSWYVKGYLLTVGSILQFNFNKSSLIWGSGIIERTTIVNSGTFLAVRGEKTRKRLMDLGYEVPEVYGDPALLLPVIYSPKPIKKYRVGIIPHVSHLSYVQENITDPNIKIISLNTNDINSVIDEINSCELILSSSLHGIIVPHAYNIPCLWVDFPIKLSGDGVKYEDYFSSVKIKNYQPFNIEKKHSLNSIELLFNNNEDLSLPNIELSKLQEGLLNAAPFLILDKYLSLIKK